MLATEDLIRQLAAGVTPRPRGAAVRRLAGAIIVGAIMSLAAILLWLGHPMAAVEYTGIPAFTMKLSFAVGMAAISAILLVAAGRPGHRIGGRLLWLLLPPALVAGTAALELSGMAPQFRQETWLGSTWQNCLVAITFLSLPVFGGIIWAFKRLAPTQLRLAGFLAGITSGSTAAVVYALYCPETTAAFLVSWYTLGIAAAGLIGLVTGARLLRW